MRDFTFFNPTKIIFGKEVQKVVGEETKKHGKKVLLHYGGGHIKTSGLYDEVIDLMRKAGVDTIELGNVVPNPRLTLVREGIKLCRKEGVDFILAVGGGSVIDSAKAIAAGVLYSGDVWDFFTGTAVPDQVLPVGVILTIPAAGSETSPGSVITDWENGNKRDCDMLRPVFAILNPELTFTLPPYQTACGASDIMAHIMERYFTRVSNVDLTDRLCEATLKTVINNVHKVLNDPYDYDARANIMWAGTIAHNDLLSTGRIADWASHMIQHELSAINDVAHGAGLSVIFPAWMKYVLKSDVSRFVQFSVRVWNVEQSFDNPEKTAVEGIERMEAFFRSIGLPTRLGEIDIRESDYERIISNCKRFDGDSVGNYVKLSCGDIRRILELAQ